ncbi:glycine betaine ABC transporter substrate-binding protein [Mangrovibacterium lignilyticum]|uniref:glycine betaine ABC transporter substrate-binding protein n=1 Tax=Mangrovibacterium lignilyticum TaxID=2668052 RepID=UPI0013CF880B|nr:glycine betaine ABC transporter substrate-binding protein [Mangrovibacterium lignilyticum]
MKKLNLLTFLIAISLTFSACTGGNKKSPDKKKVTIAMVNWIECIANTNLAKAVLEEKGYDVELVNADVAPVFAAVARGNADLFMEVWEPVTHKPYIEKFGDQIEHIGTVYTEGRLGLVVPSYVTINSIDELNSVKDKFDGKIIGINPGAGIMTIAEKVITDYNLDYELVTSSEAGMLASLKKAYDKQEWVVVTGWKPHTKFARYDLKILDDPKKTMGDAETISVIATKGWSEQNPELATFFKNFKMDDELLGSLMLAVEGNPGKESEAAKKWYEEHKTIVDAWFN